MNPDGSRDGSRLAAAGRALRTVVFDLDGVLVDSLPVMREAFGRAYREVAGDGEPPFDEYTRHLGRYLPEILELMGLPPEMEKPFVRESHRLAGEVRVYDGVPEMLAALHGAGARLGVATGKSGERARSLLELLGLLPQLDVVVGSDEVARPKPAPDIVEAALASLDADAASAIMIGDAPTDLQAARGAGAGTGAALWGALYQEELLDERPDVVLHSPADVAVACEVVPYA